MTYSLPALSRTRNRVRMAVAGAVTCSLAASVVLVGAAVPAQAATRWQSGVYTGECGKSAVARSAAGAARQSAHSGYVGGTAWDQISKLAGVGRCLAAVRLPVDLSVAMLPNGASSGGRAPGSYNAYWTRLRQERRQSGPLPRHLPARLGVQRRVVQVSRRQGPELGSSTGVRSSTRFAPSGEHFTFEWSPGLGTNSTQFAAAKAWPGVKYVSYVGASVYDVWYGRPSASPTSAGASSTTSRTGSSGWRIRQVEEQAHRHPRVGPRQRRQLRWPRLGRRCVLHHPLLCVAEGNHAAYDIYFNRQHGANEHRLAIGSGSNGTFRSAGTAYRRSFGGM